MRLFVCWKHCCGHKSCRLALALVMAPVVAVAADDGGSRPGIVAGAAATSYTARYRDQLKTGAEPILEMEPREYSQWNY